MGGCSSDISAQEQFWRAKNAVHAWKVPGISSVWKYLGMPWSSRGIQTSKATSREQTDLAHRRCVKDEWGRASFPLLLRTRYGHACMCAKLIQLCLTLCDPMDYSPPGSSVHEILQARILEWIATPSSRESPRPRDWTHVSYVRILPWQACSLPLAPPGKLKVGPWVTPNLVMLSGRTGALSEEDLILTFLGSPVPNFVLGIE